MGSDTRPEVPLFKVYVAPDAAEQTSKTLNSGYITQGPRVEEFEEKLSAYLQNPYVLTLNSATSGLHLALHMLKAPAGAWPGLKPGDEVLTTPLTCTATNWPILANGRVTGSVGRSRSVRHTHAPNNNPHSHVTHHTHAPCSISSTVTTTDDGDDTVSSLLCTTPRQRRANRAVKNHHHARAHIKQCTYAPPQM